MSTGPAYAGSLSRGCLALLGLTLAAVSGCTAPAPLPDFNVHVEDWPDGGPSAKRIVTDHWDIRTTIRDEGFHRLMPTFLELAYQQYQQLLPAVQVTDERPLVVYLFQSRGEWDRFCSRHFPRRIHALRRIQSGAFTVGDLAVCYYIRRDRTLSVMAHEGLHQYLHRNYKGEVPAWLNEGLATYSEGYEYQYKRPLFRPNRNEFRLNSLRRALLREDLIDLPELLGTHAGAVIVHSNPQVYSYYSQAWALIVYLRTGAGGRYAAGFQELLNDMGSGRLRVRAGAYVAAHRQGNGGPLSYGEAVFRVYITEDVAEFERRYQAFLKELVDFRGAGVDASGAAAE